MRNPYINYQKRLETTRRLPHQTANGVAVRADSPPRCYYIVLINWYQTTHRSPLLNKVKVNSAIILRRQKANSRCKVL